MNPLADLRWRCGIPTKNDIMDRFIKMLPPLQPWQEDMLRKRIGSGDWPTRDAAAPEEEC